MTDISVVIPTRNRAALLGKCLTSLCEQTLDPARFEVCVVNNGSTDMTAQVIDLVKAHFPKHKISLVDEPSLGVAHARNTGINNTTADLIVQGDDDATMPPDWLEKISGLFRRSGQRDRQNRGRRYSSLGRSAA